jgi:hypothetical protein
MRSQWRIKVILAGKQRVQSFRGADDGARVLREELEELVFAWHEFAKPTQHCSITYLRHCHETVINWQPS